MGGPEAFDSMADLTVALIGSDQEEFKTSKTRGGK